MAFYFFTKKVMFFFPLHNALIKAEKRGQCVQLVPQAGAISCMRAFVLCVTHLQRSNTEHLYMRYRFMTELYIAGVDYHIYPTNHARSHIPALLQ